MFKFGVISFRAIPRIVEIINIIRVIPEKIYHFTSIINWSLKLGYYKLNNIKEEKENWTAIIDASISLVNKKLFVILKTRSKIMEKREKGISLEDVEIVGLFIREKINGDEVESIVRKVFKEVGNPKQLVTDGGTDLIKGIKNVLLKEEEIIHNFDIGHIFANILKKEYSKNSQFIKLLKFTSKIGSKLRQTKAAWIIPPKLRVKGRFQSVCKLFEWAKKAFEYYQNHLDKEDKELKRLLDENFIGYQFLFDIVNKFHSECEIMNKIMKLVKKEGLSEDTYNKSLFITSKLENSSNIKIEVENYLLRNLEIMLKNKITIGILSTDIIESLFGKLKYILENSQSKDFNRISLILPLLVGEINEEMIEKALSEITMKDIKKWEKENVGETLRMKKNKEFLKLNEKMITLKYAESNYDNVA